MRARNVNIEKIDKTKKLLEIRPKTFSFFSSLKDHFLNSRHGDTYTYLKTKKEGKVRAQSRMSCL